MAKRLGDITPSNKRIQTAQRANRLFMSVSNAKALKSMVHTFFLLFLGSLKEKIMRANTAKRMILKRSNKLRSSKRVFFAKGNVNEKSRSVMNAEGVKRVAMSREIF